MSAELVKDLKLPPHRGSYGGYELSGWVSHNATDVQLGRAYNRAVGPEKVFVRTKNRDAVVSSLREFLGATARIAGYPFGEVHLSHIDSHGYANTVARFVKKSGAWTRT